jgi:hypothetical protein
MLETPLASPEVQLIGAILPEGSPAARRARIGLHLCLERARTVRQLLSELDSLAIHLCGHGDPETGGMLLAMADSIREEVTEP